MSKTYFDCLPIELLYEIFSYLWCTELFQSFYSISERIDNAINNYDYLLLDLSSDDLGKNQFDLISLILNPQRIVGLKIGKTRFNLFERYLINLNGEESLVRLRSLWIDKTISDDSEISKWFYSKIDLNKLVSFRFDNNLFFQKSNCLFENLSRLVGFSSDEFRRLSDNIPRHLNFLHMFFNSIDDLKCFIDENVNQLKSLGIGIQCQPTEIVRFSSLFNNYQWTKLIQLNLNLKG